MVDPGSIISAVDLCLRYGKKLVDAYTTFSNAESGLKEQRLRFENLWIRTKVQLEVIKSIAEEEVANGVAEELEEDHGRIQAETIGLLLSKLEAADARLQSVSKVKGARLRDIIVHRRKYLLLHHKIDQAIQDIELWQQVFDPTWYLIMRTVRTPRVATRLQMLEPGTSTSAKSLISSSQSLISALNPDPDKRHHVFLSSKKLELLQFEDISMSSAKVGRYRDDPSFSLLLDRYEITGDMLVERIEPDIRALATKLAHCNIAEFGLLECHGVVRHYDRHLSPPLVTAFTFVFSGPESLSQAQSLRGCLNSPVKPESLSDRFKIATELARSVCHVHTFGFVHKNIRPETTLLLKSEASSSSIGSVALVGFDRFRSADGETLRKGEVAWDKCLYLHPNRVGSILETDYIMQHDIYSLGVCLLELGLWETFVRYEDQDGLPSETTSIAALLEDDLSPSSIKDRLISLARGELRSAMGNKYSEVVVTCLTCLDPENADFGDEKEFKDESGLLVGTRYIEMVIMRLNDIHV